MKILSLSASVFYFLKILVINGNWKQKKEKRKKKNTSLCKKRNHVSRALLGTQFNCRDNTIVLSKVYPSQNLSMAKFIHIRLCPPVNICCYLKSMGVTKEWKLQLLAIA